MSARVVFNNTHASNPDVVEVRVDALGTFLTFEPTIAARVTLSWPTPELAASTLRQWAQQIEEAEKTEKAA